MITSCFTFWYLIDSEYDYLIFFTFHFRQLKSVKKIVPLTNTDINFALNGRLMEWGVVPVVSSICVGPTSEEELHHLGMPKRAGIVEGDQTPIVLGMYTGPTLQ